MEATFGDWFIVYNKEAGKCAICRSYAIIFVLISCRHLCLGITQVSLLAVCFKGQEGIQYDEDNVPCLLRLVPVFYLHNYIHTQ